MKSSIKDSLKLMQIFSHIRDIPYSIPLIFGEEDNSCVGKNLLLFKQLSTLGYTVRWRVCEFLWNSLSLPDKVKQLPHDDSSSHAYLEVLINDTWQIVDATWDSGLASILPVTAWDGSRSTKLAVQPTNIFSSEKSAEIINNLSQGEFEKDMKANGEFYRAFNEWLKKIRSVAENQDLTNLTAQIQFFLTLAHDYKTAAKILISSSTHPSDKFVGYPLELLFATSFELYLKTLVAIDYIIENKDKKIDREGMMKKLKKYNHGLIDLLNYYPQVKKVLGIVSLERERENAYVNHVEIKTKDKRFPWITLKNSESARYAPFSNKADYGYFHISEKIHEDKAFEKIIKGEKILDKNDKLLSMLEDLHDYVAVESDKMWVTIRSKANNL
jgi:hypothetical protein